MKKIITLGLLLCVGGGLWGETRKDLYSVVEGLKRKDAIGQKNTGQQRQKTLTPGRYQHIDALPGKISESRKRHANLKELERRQSRSAREHLQELRKDQESLKRGLLREVREDS